MCWYSQIIFLKLTQMYVWTQFLSITMLCFSAKMYPGRHNQAPPGQLGAGGGRPGPPGQGALGLGPAPPGQGLGPAPPGQAPPVQGGAMGLGQPMGQGTVPMGGLLGHALPTFGGQGGNGNGKP
jgi:hypothetical protein